MQLKCKLCGKEGGGHWPHCEIEGFACVIWAAAHDEQNLSWERAQEIAAENIDDVQYGLKEGLND